MKPINRLLPIKCTAEPLPIKPSDCYLLDAQHRLFGEHGGLAVESPTREREVVGLIPTSAVLCPLLCCVLEQIHITSTGNTQEAVAPSRHDWKIVD